MMWELSKVGIEIVQLCKEYHDTDPEIMQEVALEILQDIRDNPAEFLAECGGVGADLIVPGGTDNYKQYDGDLTKLPGTVYDQIKYAVMEFAFYGATAKGKKVAKLGKKVKDKITKKVQAKLNQKRAYILYLKRHPKGGKPYVGRTSGKVNDIKNEKELEKVLVKRDRNHHKNKEGFKPAERVRASEKKDAIRREEQQMIDKLGGAQKSGGSSSNKINGISKKNPKRGKYIKAAKKEFGES